MTSFSALTYTGHNRVARIVGSYMDPTEDDISSKKDVVKTFFSEIGTIKEPTSSLGGYSGHHRVTMIVAGYLGPEEGDLSTKKEVINTFFLTIDDSEFDVPRGLPSGYSFRLRRAFRYIAQHEESIDPQVRKQIQKWLFQNVTRALYRSFNFSNKNIKVLIAGVVSKDGMGDYFCMLHAAEQIQNAYPLAMITLGAEVQDLSKRRNNFPASPFTTIIWGYTAKNGRRVVFEDPITDSAERQKCVIAAQEATLVLELPHMHYRNSVYPNSTTIPYERIIESGGNSESMWEFNTSTGVNPFELGLIRKAIEKENNEIAKIFDKSLMKFLLETDDLSINCIELDKRYSDRHILYFAYLHYKKEDFIRLSLAHAKFDNRPFIDIIFPADFLNEEESALGYFQFLYESGYLEGISDIQSYQKKSDGSVVLYQSKNFQKSGKTLRLINPFPLINKDMLRIIARALGPIGCTGDVSLAELLSILSKGQAPFYDTPEHKMGFIKSFVALAEELFRSKDSPLVQYLRSLITDLEPEKMGKLLHDKRFSQEMILFCEYLRDYYDFNVALIDIINRMIALKFFPKLKEKEEEMLSAYQSNEINLVDYYEKFKSLLLPYLNTRSAS